MTHSKDKIENFLRHPFSWVAGGVTSVVSTVLYLGVDPISGVAAVLTVANAQAMNLFTGFSIMGFTLTGYLPGWLSTSAKALAVVFGIFVVVRILDSAWESFTKRLRDN